MDPTEREREIADRIEREARRQRDPFDDGDRVSLRDFARVELARYRAELTSDEAVLRRADEIVKSVGIRILNRGCGPGRRETGEEWSFEGTYVGASRPVGRGRSLAEAVAAMKGGG